MSSGPTIKRAGYVQVVGQVERDRSLRGVAETQVTEETGQRVQEHDQRHGGVQHAARAPRQEVLRVPHRVLDREHLRKRQAAGVNGTFAAAAASTVRSRGPRRGRVVDAAPFSPAPLVISRQLFTVYVTVGLSYRHSVRCRRASKSIRESFRVCGRIFIYFLLLC